MKKKMLIPFLFSLSLLAGCDPKPCETHDYGDWTTTKEATCGVAGSKERECKVCGYKETGEIAALVHDYVDAADQTGAVAPTCKDAGTVITQCKNCGDKKTREVPKTDGHNYVDAADQTGAVAPTCKDAGTVITECSVCGAKSTRVAPKVDTHTYVDATDQTGAVAPTCKDAGTVITECSVCGAKSTRVAPKTENHTYGEWSVTPATHTQKGSKTRTCSVCGKVDTEEIEKTPDHSFGETAVETFAEDHELTAYSVYNCEADNYKQIVWNANDVDPATKKNKYNDEDNYKVDGEGIKFGGRPIGNGMNLPASGNGNESFDANVPGAFIEYNINVKSNMTGVQLMSYMKPAQWLDQNGGLFVSAPDPDWTPGFIADTTATDGYKYAEFRYVVLVNDVEVTLDASKNVSANDARNTGWYNFPCTFDLNEGVNTIKLVQAGGWEATFYKFALVSSEAVESVAADVSEGFTVKVTGDANVTGIQFYEDKACTVEDNETVHYSRGEYGRKLDNEAGQTSFAVTVADGYEIKEIKQVSPSAKAYKNIKNPTDTKKDTGKDNVYRITQINANAEFEIVTEAVGSAVYEGYEFTFVLGAHITGIEIYNSKTCNPDTLVTGLVATSIDKSTQKPTKTDGQVYLKIFCEEGYVVDTGATTWSTETKPYNKFEAESDGGDNAYKFTKITASATITLVGKAA